MTEQHLEKYWPGDVIELMLQIQHAPMHLREVTALFFPEGPRESQGMYMRGTPSPSEDRLPAHLLDEDIMQAEALLSGQVEPHHAPGIYRLDRVQVRTYGGREHLYSGHEFGDFGFEIVKEPDDRPAVAIGFAS